MEKNEQVHLDRSIDLFSALALVIGTVIGSGIFFKQASVLSYSHSTTLALLAWFFGGVLTLTSGLTIAEIGSQMPQTGGLYIYMHNLYGKSLGLFIRLDADHRLWTGCYCCVRFLLSDLITSLLWLSR